MSRGRSECRSNQAVNRTAKSAAPLVDTFDGDTENANGKIYEIGTI
jgi:hypothetical protein